MTFSHSLAMFLLLVALAAPAISAPAAPVTLQSGDWTATLGPTGLALTHRGEVISGGSYFHVFAPEYQGAVFSSTDAWNKGTVEVSPDGRTATLTADLQNGPFSYRLELDGNTARITIRLSVKEGVPVGPVECSLLQFPEPLTKDGVIEVWNAAGLVTHREPIPATPVRGGLAPSGQGFTLKTPARKIVIEALDFGTVYPFDARHERYASRRGVWSFSSPPARAGGETVARFVVRVEPPDPARSPGRITLAPRADATAILTGTNPTARETLATDELASILEEMIGRRLERGVASGKGAPAGTILVGQAAVAAGLISQKELNAVAPDGYVVRVRGGRAGICGWRDVGTVYGAYALLRHLGCRFYAPNCETIPRRDTLVIPECTLSAKPFFEFRNLTGNLKLGHTPKDDIMDPRAIGEPGNIVHSAEYLLPYDTYHKEHPEYFALQKDGRRLTRDPDARRFDVHLCLANPDVRRISAERLLALIEKQPDRTFFGVSQGDGHAWCECEECKRLDGAPGVMTDRLLDYVNHIAREVARKYPDKRILTLAYTNATSPPPTRVFPEPNVMVQYCPYPPRTGCSSHDLTCEKNTQSQQDLLGWLEKCPKNMYIFDYPTGYQNIYEPFGSFYAMKRKLELYATRGVRGIFYCGTPRNFQDLFIYVQSHLLWNPDTPVEPLIDEFMRAYYGPAAPKVRAYFDFMHREVDERPIHQMCEGPSTHFVTPEYAETALKLLGEAEEAARDDRAALYRVRVEKLCVLFGDLNARNPFNGRLVVSEDAFARRLAEFARIARTMRLGGFVRRLPPEEWLQRVARIKPERKPWYLDPVIERLATDPAGTLAAEQQRYLQTEIPGGWRLELEGFRGARGPEEYGYLCPPRRAIWIYGTNTEHPRMWTVLHLKAAPKGAAQLVLTAQDDDKPGAVPVRVSLNGLVLFEGPNPFRERGWSTESLAIPAGVLRQGENELRIETLGESRARDAGWFMLADCQVLVP